jgi:hypothetical protein
VRLPCVRYAINRSAPNKIRSSEFRTQNLSFSTDLDDTLYPVTSGIGADVKKNIQGTHILSPSVGRNEPVINLC